MPFPSLRRFLERIDEYDMLLHIDHPVTNKWLTTAISADLFERGGSGYGSSPNAVIFENMEDYPGVKTVSNLFGHVDLISLMMGSKRSTIFDDYLRKVSHPISPMFFGDAPFQQNCYSGDDVNLEKIMPVETSAEKQTTPFLTLWTVIFEDPEDHVYSLGIYRLQVKSKNHTGLLTIEGQRTHKVIQKYRKLKKPMPIALVNGPPPTVTLASAMKAPSDVWKMDYAGALNGDGIDCFKLPDSGLPVPAEAEFVLEGEVPPNVLEDEGPFGEYSGFYGGVRKMPIIKVNKVYHRDDPIYVICNPNRPPAEEHLLGEIMLGLSSTQGFQKNFPEVKAIRPLSTWFLTMIIMVDKKMRTKDSVAKLGSEAAKLLPGVKMIIMVDDDINFWSNDDIFWSVSTKWAPNKSPLIGPLPGFLDPSEKWQTGKSSRYCMIIDATEPPEGYNDAYKRGVVDVPPDYKKIAKEYLP